MKFLGIHLGHDSNFSLIEDGKVISVFEAERFYRSKAYKLGARTLKPKRVKSSFQYIHIDD